MKGQKSLRILNKSLAPQRRGGVDHWLIATTKLIFVALKWSKGPMESLAS